LRGWLGDTGQSSASDDVIVDPLPMTAFCDVALPMAGWPIVRRGRRLLY
jgi:hypothetical protein